MLKFDAGLFDEVVAGDAAAREQMILDNMTFVQKRVGAFVKANPKYQYLRDDLVSAGYVGLVEAVNDIVKGECSGSPGGFVNLSVTDAICRCIDEDSLIQIPYRSRKRLKDIPTVTRSLPTSIPCVDTSTAEELTEEILAVCETPADRQIVLMRKQGHNDREIAQTLGLSSHTIYILRRDIYARLLARNPDIEGEV